MGWNDRIDSVGWTGSAVQAQDYIDRLLEQAEILREGSR